MWVSLHGGGGCVVVVVVSLVVVAKVGFMVADAGFICLDFCYGGGGVAIGFGLGMFFVVVVVAGGCRRDLGFCFYLGFETCYFIM